MTAVDYLALLAGAHAANEIQATYYVPFASFVCAILFYWILCLGVEGGVRSLLRVAEVRR
jgi:polar amino acid transport system permease protein